MTSHIGTHGDLCEQSPIIGHLACFQLCSTLAMQAQYLNPRLPETKAQEDCLTHEASLGLRLQCLPTSEVSNSTSAQLVLRLAPPWTSLQKPSSLVATHISLRSYRCALVGLVPIPFLCGLPGGKVGGLGDLEGREARRHAE